jgi:hypothetical protein
MSADGEALGEGVRLHAETVDPAVTALAADVRSGAVTTLTLGALCARLGIERVPSPELSQRLSELEARGIRIADFEAGSSLRTRLQLSAGPQPPAHEILREPYPSSTSSSSSRPSKKLLTIGKLVVYEHRFLSPEGRSYRISASTSATVDSSGGVAATRGRNLAAKAAGGLLVPGGVFLFGNARDRVRDYRRLYLNIIDPTWSYMLELHPDAETVARQIAMAVNRAAAATAAFEASVDEQPALEQTPIPSVESAGPRQVESAEPPPQDPIQRLVLLADLRDRGALTEEEFVREKRKLLGGP